MSTLTPKVGLLVKLAELLQGIYLADRVSMSHVNDQEVLEWYDQMAELEYVPPRRGVPAIHNAALELADDDKALEVYLELAKTGRRGYQIFATKAVHHEAEDVASYTEATSVDEALRRCLEEFPGDEYFNHGVKDIETQVVTMAEMVTVLKPVLGLD